ncbi:hypothetical protein L596_007606 [Steinernema carpocapsae]|uniref:Peptidase M13 C-terminal domain-containing protein n=1 Tax=Steinernema carpocapsae TaxID=34508 RepID=A0A4U5P9U7_STECR|nr:hypothetical protein L596_007606 [Steinernema carpocapsae]
MELPRLDIFVLFAILQASDPTFVFPHKFSRDVGACEDFHEHVCNFAENANNSFVHEFRRGFNNDVLNLLGSYDDPILSFAREVLTRRETESRLFEDGRRSGQEAAKNRSEMKVSADASSRTVEVEHKVYGKIHTRVNCNFTKCPNFVRGVVEAFFSHSNQATRIDLNAWRVVALYPSQLNNAEAPKTFAVNKKLLNTTELNPYLNLIVAKLASENGLWPSEEILQKLERIFRAVVEEAVLLISGKWWIHKNDKQTLIDMARSVQFMSYLPKEARNPQSMKEALNVYYTEFARNMDYLNFLLKTQTCDSKCLITHLGKVVHQAMWTYQQRYSGTSRYIEFWIARETQFAVALDPAWGGKGKVNVLPPILYYLKNDLPLGLFYSTATTVIAHEFMHNLGLENAHKNAHLLHKNSVYREEFECYKQLFSFFPAKSPSGVPVYPNGDLKADEAFADIEGLRIALKVFKQLEPRWTSEDLRWFFYGVEFFRCVPVSSDYDLLMKTLNSPHPRYTVRGRAQMTQVAEFSDVFGCRRGDAMFLAYQPCEVIVPLGNKNL